MSRSGGKPEVICVNVGSTVAAKAGAEAPGGGISLCFCRRGCAAPALKAATLNAPAKQTATANGIKTYSMSGLRKLAVEDLPEQIRAPYQLAQLLQLAGIVRLGNP